MKVYNIKMKSSVLWSMVIVLFLGAVSCTDMDDYKKFIKGGELTYAGKLDSTLIYSGHNRVVVTGLFLADPKITSCKLWWDDKSDSLSVPVVRTAGVDTFKISINNLTEGTHSFEIRTYNKLGNSSVPVYATGKVYGDSYQSTLVNRPIVSATEDQENVTITWGGLDSDGTLGSDVIFTDNTGKTQTQFCPIKTTTMNLPNYAEGTSFQYRTLFLPDSMAIDTFSTAYQKQEIMNVIDMGQIPIGGWNGVNVSAFDPTTGLTLHSYQYAITASIIMFDNGCLAATDIDAAWHGSHGGVPRFSDTGIRFAKTNLTASDFDAFHYDSQFEGMTATENPIAIQAGDIIFFQTKDGRKGLLKVVKMTDPLGDILLEEKLQKYY